MGPFNRQRLRNAGTVNAVVAIIYAFVTAMSENDDVGRYGSFVVLAAAILGLIYALDRG